MSDYVTPAHGLSSFNCPHCGSLAQQGWPDSVLLIDEGAGNETWRDVDRSRCFACHKIAVWDNEPQWVTSGPSSGWSSPRWEIVWPPYEISAIAHPDLPDELRALYEEARGVASVSPRSAAALLRLVSEGLVKYKLGKDVRLADGSGNWLKTRRLIATLRRSRMSCG